MQLILREDVPSLGSSGDIVEVKGGYGRNYLVPRGLAVAASVRNVSQIEHQKRAIAQREAKHQRAAASLKAKIEGLSLNIAKQVGEDDRLFGAVTNKEIAEVLEQRGLTIDRKQIAIETPIRALGVHTVTVRLGRATSAELKVWVVAQGS